MNSLYHLLALCARAQGGPAHYERLAQHAAQLTAWQGLPALAEAHGMAPLLYTHLKAAQVQPPLTVQRELQGLYLRHRQANHARMRALRDIAAAYSAARIPYVVLKGAALANVVYPEPGLRPMSDLDLLVAEADLQQAQGLLAELGFDTPLPSPGLNRHRHLHAATLEAQGVSVHVEIHHRLFSNYFDNAAAYARSKLSPARRAQASHLNGLTIPPRPFALAGQTAWMPGLEDMLWHLCRHLVSHVNVWDYARLIWVADIVSLAEQFAADIDWERVRRERPGVLNTLSVLHFMTPLSDELLSRAKINIGRAPQGIGIDYQGWPRAQNTNWRQRLRHTLSPSEWWLRLRYNLDSAQSVFWYRWVRHPLHILGHVVRVFLEKLGWPTPLELAQGK